jgi:hypothetical protein
MSEPMTDEEIVRYVVAKAVWAPSVHNTQPWRFTADGGPGLSLHADTGRRLAVADPDGREMMISCGAALFTIRLALRSLGWIVETRVLPDPAQPTLVARVSWRERAAADGFERRLSGHVHTRRTHRGAFDPEPLPPDTLAALRDAAVREGAALRIVADDGRRAALAAAIQTAEYELRRDGERLPRRSVGYLLSGAGRAHPAGLSRPGLRPRARLGGTAAQRGHLASGGRRGRVAHHDRRPPGGLGARRAGAAADLAHRQRVRGRRGAA